MRNLKKILALALALVMTLSVMTVANAAFTDEKDINGTYAEAVDVLSSLGVFKGTGTGTTFSPKQSITRAEVAAIIYRIVTGDVTDKQASIYADYAKFNDVKSTAWYAGYVGYCSNANLIKGDGKGNFLPTATVTGYQALAMILRAMGYDVNGEFTGSGWEVKVASTAQQRGILKNVNAGTLGTAAAREVVAELLFQAIQKATVVYTPALGYYSANLLNVDTTSIGYKTFGLNRIAGTVTAKGTQVTVKGAEDIGAKYSGNTLTNPTDVVVPNDQVFETGRDAYVWTTESANGYHKALTALYFTDNVLATKYDGQFAQWTTASTVWNPASANFVAALDANAATYVNGTRTNLPAANAIKKGDEVRLIDSDGNGKIDLVLVLDEVVKTVGAAGVRTTTGQNSKTYITVAGVVDVMTDSALVSGYAGLVAGDVVLYVKPYTGITYLTKANVVNGVKTAYSTATGVMTFGGNDYTKSGLTGTSVAKLFSHEVTNGTFGVNYNLYLDRGGYAIAESEVKTAASYAVVLDAGYTLSTTIGTYGQYTFYATLLNMDGTTTQVETDTLYRAATLSSDNLALVGKTAHNYINHFVKVGTGVNNGKTVTKLTLVNAAANDNCSVTGTVAFSNTNPNFGNYYYASNATVYLVLNRDGSVTRYVGYASVPAMTAAQYCVLTNASYSRLAEYVFIVNPTNTASNTYYVWAKNANVTTTTKDWSNTGMYTTAYTYTGLYQDGQQVLIDARNNVSADIQNLINGGFNYMKIAVVNGTATVTGLYYKDGVLNGRTVSYVDATTETIAIDDPTTGAANSYVGSNVKVYDVTGPTVVASSVSAISVGDKVTAIVDKNNVVVAVYKTANSGNVVVLANDNVSNPWGSVLQTVGFSGNKQVGEQYTITLTHANGTFGQVEHTLTLSNGQIAKATPAASGQTSLTFTFTVQASDLYTALTVVSCN